MPSSAVTSLSHAQVSSFVPRSIGCSWRGASCGGNAESNSLKLLAQSADEAAFRLVVPWLTISISL